MGKCGLKDKIMNIYSNVICTIPIFKDECADDTLYPVAQADGEDVIAYAATEEIARFLSELLNKERSNAS